MFNNSESQTSDLASMDDILGAEVGEVAIYQRTIWPVGSYLWVLTEYEARTYDIRNEEHPDAGKKAPMIMLKFVCVGFPPKAKYVDLKKRKVDPELIVEKLGHVKTENFLFGSDHLPDDKNPGKRRNTGARKFATFMHGILGTDGYEAVKNLSRGAQLEEAKKVVFIADLGSDMQGKDTQFDLFGEFIKAGDLDNPEVVDTIQPAMEVYARLQAERKTAEEAEAA